MSNPSTRSFVGTNSPDGTVVGVAPATPLGFYGVNTPLPRGSLPAAATDAATTQALANAIRQYLIDRGLAV